MRAQRLMHAIAHDGCTDTVRESAVKVDSGRKVPCRDRESNLPQRRAGPTFCQLSYIPHHFSLHSVSKLAERPVDQSMLVKAYPSH